MELRTFKAQSGRTMIYSKGSSAPPILKPGLYEKSTIQVEKGVDVAIACRMLRRAMTPSLSEKVDYLIVVSGDSD